jgi:APA family basic amino acid/polyamine antiporter
MAEKTLFARRATGLVREIGFTTAVILAIANVVGAGWQKRVFQSIAAESVPSAMYFLGIHPMIMAFFLIGILMLLSIYTFMVLSAAMPRSGGGYVFMSRIVSPGFSFVATCLEFFSVAVSYGLIAVLVFEATLIFGDLAGLDTSRFATPWFLTIFGVVVVGIFSGIACLGTRMTGYVLHVMFWIPAAILVLVYLMFVVAMVNPAVMEQGVVNFTGHTAIEYTQAAVDHGLTAGSYWSAVLVACGFAYWAYIGYAAATFVAGEVKEAGRNLPKAILISGIVIMLIYMTISFFLAQAGTGAGVHASGFTLLEGVGYLEAQGAWGDLPSIGAWMPTFAGLAAYGQLGVQGGQLFGYLLLAFSMLWIANDIPPFILTCSRMMFAMGFDRILPEWVADVNEKWHSPVNAIIVTSVVSLMGVFAEANFFGPGGLEIGLLHQPFGLNFINSAGMVIATDLWDCLFFSGVALACALFPSRMPEVFERSPWRQSKSVVQIMGWVALVANVVLALVLILHPKLIGFGPLTGSWVSLSFWFTIVLILIALVVYFWGRSRARRVGADLTTIFAEIPPE